MVGAEKWWTPLFEKRKILQVIRVQKVKNSSETKLFDGVSMIDFKVPLISGFLYFGGH